MDIKNPMSLTINYKVVNIWCIWQSYKQEHGCLMHFLRVLAVCWPGAQSALGMFLLTFMFYKIVKQRIKDAVGFLISI